MTAEDDFRVFYQKWRSPIRRSLALALGDVGLADEAVDEAMTRAVARWDMVSGYDRPEGWLYRVCQHRLNTDPLAPWSTLSIKATAPMGPGCQLGPATAEGLADSIRSELDITAPVVVSSEALIIDVVNDPDAMTVLQRICDLGVVRLMLQSPGDSTRRIRLHLLDSPEGSSMPILAIALVAPESDFERAVEAAAPVIESVEFHVP